MSPFVCRCYTIGIPSCTIRMKHFRFAAMRGSRWRRCRHRSRWWTWEKKEFLFFFLLLLLCLTSSMSRVTSRIGDCCFLPHRRPKRRCLPGIGKRRRKPTPKTSHADHPPRPKNTTPKSQDGGGSGEKKQEALVPHRRRATHAPKAQTHHTLPVPIHAEGSPSVGKKWRNTRRDRGYRRIMQ